MVHDYDILDAVGKPLMFASGVIYIISNSEVAKWLCFTGCMMEISWVIIDMSNAYHEYRKK